MGNKSLKKGYLEGLKIGILFSLFVIILSIIFGTISLYSIFIIFICILSSILGAMIGINKKTDSLE